MYLGTRAHNTLQTLQILIPDYQILGPDLDAEGTYQLSAAQLPTAGAAAEKAAKAQLLSSANSLNLYNPSTFSIISIQASLADIDMPPAPPLPPQVALDSALAPVPLAEFKDSAEVAEKSFRMAYVTDLYAQRVGATQAFKAWRDKCNRSNLDLVFAMTNFSLMLTVLVDNGNWNGMGILPESLATWVQIVIQHLVDCLKVYGSTVASSYNGRLEPSKFFLSFFSDKSI